MTTEKYDGRWWVMADGLANEYTKAYAALNGIDIKSPEARRYSLRLNNAIKKAVVAGEMRAFSTDLSCHIEPGEQAYADGMLSLEQFCSWAQGILPGCPADAAVLAQYLGFEVELSPSMQSPPVRRVMAFSAQEDAILEEIRRLGHDPLNFPKNSPGKSGVKKEIRTALANNKLFIGDTVFDKAWGRLRGKRAIVDKK